MAKLNFGGTVENVVTREEFPLAKAQEVLKNETVAVIGYGVQGPGQALNQKENGKKVAIIDWDVHHGNGTQDIFWNDPSILYCSTHEMPLYPGTGAETERGVGNIVNAPLRPHSGGPEFRAAFERKIIPALDKFAPELIIVSAGFDAHEQDPLGQLRLTTAGFGRLTRMLLDVADEVCAGRAVIVTEGGYDLDAIEIGCQ